MKFLQDKVAFGKHEWRVLADTDNPKGWVTDGRNAYEFESVKDAYAFVIDAYRRVADLRNMQPGQSYSLTMADGSQRQMQVQQNSAQGVQVMDPNSGEQMTIPHVQSGVEPTPIKPQNPKQSTPTIPGNSPGVQVGVSPENRTYSLGKRDLRVTAADIGREPYQCKHDNGYLYRKEPSAPEKYCAQCGMVYAASKTAEDGHMTQETKVCGKCYERYPVDQKCPCEKTAGCDSDYYVEGDDCSCDIHKGKQEKKSKREVFRAWKNRERIVRAFDIIAEPAMPQQQAMPSAEVKNDSQVLEQDNVNFAEEEESSKQNPADPNAKRKLTPHEIIEEAESLIRNALVKGVKIGAAELSEYMTQYYQNAPDELMQGIALAWQKVQYEEQMDQATGDPNAPQGKGFGPQAPTTPEEAAQMAPKNGPIQTKRLM